jgi:hypothetical protein
MHSMARAEPFVSTAARKVQFLTASMLRVGLLSLALACGICCGALADPALSLTAASFAEHSAGVLPVDAYRMRNSLLDTVIT